MDKRYGITSTISGLLGQTNNGADAAQSRVVTTRERVTPRIAQDWLNRHNDQNRRVRESHVATLAQAMEAGRWLENGVPIAFSRTGRLLDGQHRLRAVIASGRSQWFSIVRGLPDAVYDTYDQGSARTTADLLDARGEVNTNTLAASARLLLNYRRSGHFRDPNPAPSRAEILAHVDQEPGLRDSVRTALGLRHELRAIQPALLVTLYHLCQEKSPEDATIFFERWASGLGLTERDDPIYVLRTRFENDALLRQRSSRLRDMQAALVFKAWNAMRAGQRLKLLRWNANTEAFPVPK